MRGGMAQVSPEDVIDEVRAGRLRPVYVVVGEERFFRQRVVEAVRLAVVGGTGPSLNEDQFIAGEVDARSVIAAARTLPMFGTRRLVLVRGLERWDARAETEGEAGKGNKPLDQLAEYAASPSPSTTLLLVADKLDSRRRLITGAKKDGCLVTCAALPRHALAGWVRERAREHQHAISPQAAELLAELVGSDLCAIADAIERVELFVGQGAELTESAIAECVANLQPASVWDLVNAVGRRDAPRALGALGRVFEPGAGPRLVGLLAWSARQLIRFGSARRAGLSPDEAAKRAGVPPFKVREINEQLRHLPLERAEQWLEVLAQIDLDLKGGSRLPQRAVLESAVLSFCR